MCTSRTPFWQHRKMKCFSCARLRLDTSASETTGQKMFFPKLHAPVAPHKWWRVHEIIIIPELEYSDVVVCPLAAVLSSSTLEWHYHYLKTRRSIKGVGRLGFPLSACMILLSRYIHTVSGSMISNLEPSCKIYRGYQLHLALLPITFCIMVVGHSGLRRARIFPKDFIGGIQKPEGLPPIIRLYHGLRISNECLDWLSTFLSIAIGWWLQGVCRGLFIWHAFALWRVTFRLPHPLL
jgi:hypothetical protein